MTVDELILDLSECARRGLYFEISDADAQLLLDYIRQLECEVRDLRSAAEDDQGVL